ncbi:MAG: DinB family protein [Phycisphaerales bacterium]|nr:DinB family protein [Phycisphaerales bacterium]
MEFDIERDTKILARTPLVIRALLGGLGREWSHSNYRPGTWSPHEVVGHLIHGERTDWIPRARMILKEGESREFEPFDRKGHEELCRESSLGELLEVFERERNESLAALRALRLTDEKLRRRGRHPALGTVTLSELLATWVVHDLNHIAQICKAMAYQHKSEVGPWEAYLSILGKPAPR